MNSTLEILCIMMIMTAAAYDSALVNLFLYICIEVLPSIFKSYAFYQEGIRIARHGSGAGM